MRLTSPFTAVDMMVNTLLIITLLQLLAHNPGLHHANPLLTDDGILRGLVRGLVVKVDAVEGWGNFWLFGKEGFGFGGEVRHCCWGAIYYFVVSGSGKDGLGEV